MVLFGSYNAHKHPCTHLQERVSRGANVPHTAGPRLSGASSEVCSTAARDQLQQRICTLLAGEPGRNEGSVGARGCAGQQPVVMRPGGREAEVKQRVRNDETSGTETRR